VRSDDQPARDPLPVVEPEAAPLPRGEDKERSRLLRSQDGDVSQMPAFLQAPAAAAPAAEEAERRPKPRTRTRKRTFEAGEGEAAPTGADEDA
jgi:hypothetical protein